MSVYTVFPKRGIVDPKQSAIAVAAGLNPNPSEQVFLVFDATIKEAPQFAAQPTKSLVEDASTIADHVVIQPLRVQMDVIISDTPLQGTPFASLVSGTFSAFSGTLPSKKAYDYIKALWKSGAVFDLAGGFEVYNNMVIAEFHPTRDENSGSALEFSLTLEQVTIVNAVVLTVPSNTKASAKDSQGGQPMETVDVNSHIYGAVLDAVPTVSSPSDLSEFGPSAGGIVNILSFK